MDVDGSRLAAESLAARPRRRPLRARRARARGRDARDVATSRSRARALERSSRARMSKRVETTADAIAPTEGARRRHRGRGCAGRSSPRARSTRATSAERRGKGGVDVPRARGGDGGAWMGYDTPAGSPTDARGRTRADGGRGTRGKAVMRNGGGGWIETRGGGGVDASRGKRGEMSGLEDLPRDCLLHVCGFMDASSVEALGRTSRTMREVTLDDSLWRTLCESRWRMRPAKTWARSARLPFASRLATAANAEKLTDIRRGGKGWRAAYKERYRTRGIAVVADKRIIRVDCAAVGGVMHASTLQRVLNATTSGDVVELGPGTYKGSLTIPRGIELVGVGNRERIRIESDETPALRTARAKNTYGTGSVVTNLTLCRKSSTKRGSLSGDGHQACVYISDGSRLRLDSCDIISAGEGVVATGNDSIAQVHACNIHTVLSSFLTTSGGSLTACRITAAISIADSEKEDEEMDEIEDVTSSLGYDRLFAAVSALSGNVEISNNRIVNGHAHGVVMFDCAHGEIHDNLIANNVGAGISIGISSTANISHTIVANNCSVGVAMCGRGVIQSSEVRGNAFNGIDISQRYTTRDYFTAHADDFDEELDLEEEFSAFLMDLDTDESEDEDTGEIDVVVKGCHISANANDGICVSGGAKVDIIGSELCGNFCNLAIDRGNVRWSEVLAEGDDGRMVALPDSVGMRITGSHSTLDRIPVSKPTTPVKREPAPITMTPKLRRFVPERITVVL